MDEPGEREDEADGVGFKIKGALVKMGTHKIGHQKREQHRTGVTKNEKKVKDEAKISLHKVIITDVW